MKKNRKMNCMKKFAVLLALAGLAGCATDKHVQTEKPEEVAGIVAYKPDVVEVSAERRMKLPSPILFFYGWGDNIVENEEFAPNLKNAYIEALDSYNIIEGTTVNAELVKKLRSEGKIFAYQTWLPVRYKGYENVTLEQVVDHLAQPFENTLGGELPGGFDAICIDEFGPDIDPKKEQMMVDVLKELRRRYPDRLIICPITSSFGQLGPKGHEYVNKRQTGYLPFKGQPRTEIFNAIRDYSDLMLYEWYASTSRNPGWEFCETASRNIQAVSPGLEKKTVVLLSVAQYDDRAEMHCFNSFLDWCMAKIRRDEVWTNNGVGFWVAYRAKPDTLRQFVKLADHYFTKGNTDYYGTGDFKNPVQNPGFESEDMAAWTYEGTEGGYSRVKLADEGIAVERYPNVSNGNYSVKLTMGDNKARGTLTQRVKVAPGGVYRVSAYVYSKLWNMATWQLPAELRVITNDDGIPNGLGATSQPQFIRSPEAEWRELAVTVAVPFNCSSIDVIMNNRYASPGDSVYFDIVTVDRMDRVEKDDK